MAIRFSIRLSSILLVLFSIAACGGGKSAPPVPEHLASGMPELVKGLAWYRKGCYHRSLDHFFTAHERFTVSDQQAGTALSLNNIGNVYRAVGRVDDALRFYDEAFEVFSKLGMAEAALQAAVNRAAALIDAGRLDGAGAALDQAESMARDRKTPFVPLLRYRGVWLLRKKAFDVGETMLNKALEAVAPDDSTGRAGIHAALGRLMAETGRTKAALAHFEAALADDRQAGFYHGIAEDLAELGGVLLKKGDFAGAAGYFRRSVRIHALLGNGKRVEALSGPLREAAEKAGIDLTLTDHFVESWLKGKAVDRPCD